MYFQVHQPLRLRKFSIFDEHSGPMMREYFDEELNRKILHRVATKCYYPANNIMLELLNRYDGRFKVAYSISGSLLEQAKLYEPHLIESFQKLADTGHVEFLCETYYHSLSSLWPKKDEFYEQVRMQKKLIEELFSYTPKTFRNTELLFSTDIAKLSENCGFKGILAEGIEHVLGWRSPNFVYKARGSDTRILFRNYRLSDDVAYRFSAKWWGEYPLTADKYALWLSKVKGQTINLFMDYETFGEHHWADTGIFDFLKHFPEYALRHPDLSFSHPHETVKLKPADEIDVLWAISWADIERDSSAWLGNKMQHMCFELLQKLEGPVRELDDPEYYGVWRYLQNSDHLYYLCTKSLADGDVHKYFSPYGDPFDGFVTFINILHDFKDRIDRKLKEKQAKEKKNKRK